MRGINTIAFTLPLTSMIIYKSGPSEYIKVLQVLSATDSDQYKTNLTVTDTSCFNISTKSLK